MEFWTIGIKKSKNKRLRKKTYILVYDPEDGTRVMRILTPDIPLRWIVHKHDSLSKIRVTMFLYSLKHYYYCFPLHYQDGEWSYYAENYTEG